MHWMPILAVSMAILIIAMVLYARHTYSFWTIEGEKLRQPGYLTPRVPVAARILRVVAGRLCAFFYVGPIKWINKQYSQRPGRYLIVCNHQTERDALMVLRALGFRYYRFLIAQNQIYDFNGWRVPAAAFNGALPVDLDKSPRTAVKTAIKALTEEPGSSLMVFPQGALKPTNELKREEFHAGILLIGKQAAKTSKEPYFLLTMAVHYDRDHAHATRFHRLMNAIGFRKFRTFFDDTTYGATVAFGEPIPLGEIPDNLKAGTDLMFEKIVETSKLASGAA